MISGLLSFNCRSSNNFPDRNTRFRTTQTVALGTSKAFDRVCHAGILYKIESFGISGHDFSFIASFPGKRWLKVLADGKS